MTCATCPVKSLFKPLLDWFDLQVRSHRGWLCLLWFIRTRIYEQIIELFNNWLNLLALLLLINRAVTSKMKTLYTDSE